MTTMQQLEAHFDEFGIIKAAQNYNGMFTTYVIWTASKPSVDSLSYASISVTQMNDDWQIIIQEK